jgi:hypothetical protein
MDNPDPRQPADPLGDDGGTTRIDQQRNQRLAERALAEHWEISAERRAELLDKLFKIATHPKTNARATTSAARVILQAAGLNLASVTAGIRAQEHEELVARLEELEKLAQKEERS